MVDDYEDDITIAKTEHNEIHNNSNFDDDENQTKFTNSRHEPGSHSKHISISQGF